MYDIIEELIDVHNVTNILEGYPQFVINKTTFHDTTMYHLNLESKEYYKHQFIRFTIYPNYIHIMVEYHNRHLIKYLNKKYNSRSSGSGTYTIFEIRDEGTLGEFVKKDIELILEYYINDAGVV